MERLRDRLPFWLSGREASALADAAQQCWEQAQGWLREALAQTDIRYCSLKALERHAADRGIVRLPGESEALWRRRTRTAITQAREAGSKRGLEQLLAAYGAQRFSIVECPADCTWDIVEIQISEARSSVPSPVLDEVLRQWGRVGRRFVYRHSTPVPVWGIAMSTGELQQITYAR